MSMDFLPLILIFLLAIYNGKHLTSDINKDKCPSIRTPVLVCVLFEFQFFIFDLRCQFLHFFCILSDRVRNFSTAKEFRQFIGRFFRSSSLIDVFV